MDDKFAKFISNLDLNAGASNALVQDIQSQLGLFLPDDYIEFMMESNGAEGRVGPNAYLQLWSLGELPSLNKGYAVDEFAPGIVLFGSSGGGEAFAFDIRAKEISIIAIPFIFEFEYAKVCGRNFVSFLEYLYHK